MVVVLISAIIGLEVPNAIICMKPGPNDDLLCPLMAPAATVAIVMMVTPAPRDTMAVVAIIVVADVCTNTDANVTNMDADPGANICVRGRRTR